MDNITSAGFSFDLPKGNSSIIKVIGVGGGGNNALKHMYEKGIHGVDFVICNTDSQTLDNHPVSNKVQLGLTITEGLGAGADPEIGEKAAIESIEDIKAALGQNTKMVFITAGMGGGTGTGAAPVIAKVAKDMGILTVGIVTVPFSFEGKRRLEQADSGLDKLRNNVDSLIVINNDKLRQQFGNLGFKSGFAKADEVLTNAAKGMAEVITGYFDVNIDFRDAKSVLENSGTALMSTGIASGENKAEEAVKKALDSPLLNDNKITGAKNVLLLIRSGSEEITMDEIGVIMDHIQQEAGNGNIANIIFGVGSDEELGDAVSVLVIATGFSNENPVVSGITEKINFTLSDSIASKSQSEIKPNIEQTSVTTPPTSSKDLYILDDERDFPTNEFPMKTAEKKANIEKETIVKSQPFEVNEEIDQQLHQQDIAQEFDLFSYNDDLDDEPTSHSFSFETEEKREEKIAKKTNPNEAKPLEFSFFVNEPADEPNEAKLELKTIEKKEPEQKPEPIEMEKPAEKPTFEIEDNFTFITKSTNNEKALERRNKLKEFNSRYQNFEPENHFETVPAFRRKNISIGEENASDQKITNFLAENNGKMEIKENRFLNKDVD